MRWLRPPTPAAPTIGYQIVLNLTLGSPRVGETPTLGYPYSIDQITISSDRAALWRIPLCFHVARDPWLSGDPHDAHHLAFSQGDDAVTDQRQLIYYAFAPLTIRPRIYVSQPGTRLRLVNDLGGGGAPSVRAQFILTPH